MKLKQFFTSSELNSFNHPTWNLLSEEKKLHANTVKHFQIYVLFPQKQNSMKYQWKNNKQITKFETLKLLLTYYH